VRLRARPRVLRGITGIKNIKTFPVIIEAKNTSLYFSPAAKAKARFSLGLRAFARPAPRPVGHYRNQKYKSLPGNNRSKKYFPVFLACRQGENVV